MTRKKRMAWGSFISEHTAEYFLVPDIATQLASSFPKIIPVFFWSTREGNKLALKKMTGMDVRLCTVFPRRPKITTSKSDRIGMKINQELLQYAHDSRNQGIPVIAGVPCAASLLDLGSSARCAWFDLSALTDLTEDCFIEIALADGTAISQRPERDAVLHSLTGSELRAVASRGKIRSWENSVESLKSLRSSLGRNAGYPFFGGYKPFHLILST